MLQIFVLCDRQSQTHSGLYLFGFVFVNFVCSNDSLLKLDQKMLQSINGAGGAAALIGFLQNNAHIYFEPPDIDVRKDEL